MLSFAFSYEEIVSTCFLVCGFVSVIKIYDFSLNLWTKEIPTIGAMFFLKVIHAKQENPWLVGNTVLIFHKNLKEIVLVDLINSKVLKQISLNDAEKINDLSSWNSEKNLFILGTQTSIKLLDITNMKIMNSIEIGYSFKFTKILIKNKETRKFKEHFAFTSVLGNIKIY